MEQNDISSRIVFADRGKVNVEKGVEFAPKFDQNGLIPALAMDHITHEPLMLAYMNAESLRMTMELGEAVYYSRSRQEIWHKGATSGHVQKVKQILVDCDQDALIVLVEPGQWVGRGQVLDIERETELGGPIHSKGVLILSAFLGARFGAKRPMAPNASIDFEQSYYGAEGDGASSAELCELG